MDLSTILARRADFIPDKPALVFEEQSVSYASFCTRVARASGALASLGVTTGDRVAVLAQNHPAILELLFACARLGAILVPLNWRLAVPRASVHSRQLYAQDSCRRSGPPQPLDPSC